MELETDDLQQRDRLSDKVMGVMVDCVLGKEVSAGIQDPTQSATPSESRRNTAAKRKFFSKHSMSRRIHGAMARISQESMRYHHDQPWSSMDAGDWGPLRVFLAKIILTHRWEALMGTVAALNLIVIVWEADYTAQCYPAYKDNLEDCPFDSSKVLWVMIINWSLLFLYTVEVVARLYVTRRAFFFNKWNLLDGTIVVSGWLGVAIGGESVMSGGLLRMLRAVRLLRTLRIVLSIRELYLLLTGMISSLKSIFWGTFLLCIVLALWGVVLVEFVHPTNSSLSFDGCDDCAMAFQNVPSSMLMIFKQVITGDSWGETNVPLIKNAPYLAPIPIGIVLTVSVGLMNLILAVIVESAGEARERDTETKLKQLEENQIKKKVELLEICQRLDKDNNGKISLREMHDAWNEHAGFRRVMCDLHVTKNDLDRVFEILDEGCAGAVDYTEFIEQIYELRTHDTWVLLAQQRNAMMTFKKEIVSMLSDLEVQQEEQRRALDRHSEVVNGVLSKSTEVWDSLSVKVLGAERLPHASGCWTNSLQNSPSPHLNGEAQGWCDESLKNVGNFAIHENSRIGGRVQSDVDSGFHDSPSDKPGDLVQRSLDRIVELEEEIADRARSASVAVASRLLAALEAERSPPKERVEWLEKHVRQRFAALARDLESWSSDQAAAFDDTSRLVEALSTGQLLQESLPPSAPPSLSDNSPRRQRNGTPQRFASGQRARGASSSLAAPVAPREPTPPPPPPRSLSHGTFPAAAS